MKRSVTKRNARHKHRRKHLGRPKSPSIAVNGVPASTASAGYTMTSVRSAPLLAYLADLTEKQFRRSYRS
jgi:hypothetical protein